MSELAQTDIPGYSKRGGAIVSTDNSALESYKLRKNVNRRIAVLEKEVAELREIVTHLLEKADG